MWIFLNTMPAHLNGTLQHRLIKSQRMVTDPATLCKIASYTKMPPHGDAGRGERHPKKPEHLPKRAWVTQEGWDTIN